jgi:hypothetical protein
MVHSKKAGRQCSSSASCSHLLVTHRYTIVSFTILVSPPLIGLYSHPDFRQGLRKLCHLITRRKQRPSSSKNKKASSTCNGQTLRKKKNKNSKVEKKVTSTTKTSSSDSTTSNSLRALLLRHNSNNVKQVLDACCDSSLLTIPTSSSSATISNPHPGICSSLSYEHVVGRDHHMTTTGAPWMSSSPPLHGHIISTPHCTTFPSSISLSSSSHASASPASPSVTAVEDDETGWCDLLLQDQIDIDVITGGKAFCPVLEEDEDPFDIIREIISTFQNN